VVAQHQNPFSLYGKPAYFKCNTLGTLFFFSSEIHWADMRLTDIDKILHSGSYEQRKSVGHYFEDISTGH
jgi:hypothetical protein